LGSARLPDRPRHPRRNRRQHARAVDPGTQRFPSGFTVNDQAVPAGGGSVAGGCSQTWDRRRAPSQSTMQPDGSRSGPWLDLQSRPSFGAAIPGKLSKNTRAVATTDPRRNQSSHRQQRRSFFPAPEARNPKLEIRRNLKIPRGKRTAISTFPLFSCLGFPSDFVLRIWAFVHHDFSNFHVGQYIDAGEGDP
jgi:hypothetical protein